MPRKKKSDSQIKETHTAPSLFDEEQASVFTVSGFLDHINQSLAGEQSYVQGEIASSQPHPTGLYFTLKDSTDESVLNCYMRPWVYRGLGIQIQDGMQVKVGGALNIYKPKGRASFLADSLELVGEGSLKKAYELLRAKLEAEGLFARKRPLPEFIHSIGLVTSRTGAAIGDFRKNLASMGFRVELCDARVEGLRAVEDVSSAVRWLGTNRSDLDVLVIIRGGGGLEDLQAFNNERVAREIFASKIPTICGIGHERDISIASMVADQEVSTPSMAAMLVNDSWNRLREALPLAEQELTGGMERLIQESRSRVDRVASVLAGSVRELFAKRETLERAIANAGVAMGRRIDEVRESLVSFGLRSSMQVHTAYTNADARIEAYARLLEAASPERNLAIGYSIVRNAQGRIIKSIAEIKKGERMRTQVRDGAIISLVEKLN